MIYALNEDFLKAEQLINKANEFKSGLLFNQIAESIYFNHKNPMKAKNHLVKALKNSGITNQRKTSLLMRGITRTTSSTLE